MRLMLTQILDMDMPRIQLIKLHIGGGKEIAGKLIVACRLQFL